MKNSINLITPTSRESSKEKDKLKLLQIAAICAVAFTGMSSLILFLITAQISPSGIKKQQEEVSAEISRLNSKQAKVILVSQKTKEIQSITKNRPEYDTLMQEVLDEVPKSVDVGSIKLDKLSLSMSISSSSLLPMDEFIKNFTKMAIEKRIIKNLTIKGIFSSGKAGSYSTSIVADRI